MACSSYSAVSKDFASCVPYTLSCLNKEDVVLKHEQVDALDFFVPRKGQVDTLPSPPLP